MLQNKQKPNYCAEHQDVNVEVTWTESGYTYPERSDGNLTEVRASAKVGTYVRLRITLWYHQKSAEVIVSLKRAPEKPEKSHTRMKD
jgi:hypothetical protein